MMNRLQIVDFISSLRQKGIVLKLEGSDLLVKASGNTLTADLKSEIKAHKQEIIATLRQIGSGARNPQSSISAMPEEEPIPLSFSQQRLWFIAQLNEEHPAYNIATGLELRGKIDEEALSKSISYILHRHEAFRTTFYVRDGEPYQRISGELPFALECIDLHHLPEDEKRQSVGQLIKDESRWLFDLGNGPLFRIRFLKLQEEQHLLLVTLHHIICDAWSIKIFLEELSILYPAFINNCIPSLPPLPIQYKDYAYWQRKNFRKEHYEKELSYWKRQLSGRQTALNLPTDYRPKALHSFRGKQKRFEIDTQLTDSLRALSRQEGVTLFVTLLSSFYILLYRYSLQEEIVIGTPVANRTREETKSLFGFLVDTLPLCFDLNEGQSLSSLLQKTKQLVLEAFENRELPFEKLVEELQPERSLSQNPLFQVMFALQNISLGTLTLPGTEVCPLSIDNETAKFDLTLIIEEGAKLSATLEYNTDLFSEATIDQFARYHCHLLRSIIASDRDAPWSLLSLMDGEDKEQTIKRTKSQYIPIEKGLCLHEIFARQARKNPDSIALSFEGREITYAELNLLADKLALFLRQDGLVKGEIVGLCLEPSIELIVAILGILKAGGAYMPIAIDLPEKRLLWMLADGRVRFLVSQQFIADRHLPDSVQTVYLDDVLLEEPDPARFDFQTDSSPDDLAYLIYTSGSTGEPKGVLITHYNAVRLFQATEHQFGFNERDVWTLFHSYTFDFSVWEIWGALLYGGKLVIVPFMVSRDPEAFYQLLVQQKVSVLNQTPSAFRQLMKAESDLKTAGGLGNLNLRYIVFGGEALNVHELKPWWDQHGDRQPQLINMYGITETTVHVTFRPLSAQDLESGKSVIGAPLQDLELYILDNHLQPVPPGVPGEIYVGGGGLAKGYLNRPQLTEERFIPDPFSTDENKRLYRTGDLARFRADGDLLFMGRLDKQVKMRGYRIELGEIEAVLKRYPNITHCKVIFRRDEPPSLAAYYITKANEPIRVEDLRLFLKQELPGYMVPALLVRIDEFPLTQNGKLDEVALVNTHRSLDERKVVPPQTPEEKLLAEVWQEVLKKERIGIYDNYFELGGDSILSIAILAKARERNLKFSLKDIYQYQNIHDLAAIVGKHEEESEEESTAQAERFLLLSKEDGAKIPADQVEDAYPAGVLQAGMLFHSQWTESKSVYHNVNGYLLEASLNTEHFTRAVSDLIERHPVLRAGFNLSDYSEPLLLISKKVAPPVSFHDISACPESEQQEVYERWFEEERQNYFDWSSPPLFRINIFKCSPRTFYFTLSEHHAIMDGWSVASFITELFHQYMAYEQGLMPMLENSPAPSFRDFIILEKKATTSDEGLAYWREHLKDFVSTPFPYTPSSNTTPTEYPLKTVDFVIPAEQSVKLSSLAHSLNSHVKNVLLAVHLKVIGLLTNTKDVLTGLVMNGRVEAAGGEKTLGLFLNTLPFRVLLKEGSWADLIRQIIQTEQSHLPHRRVPLSVIKNESGGIELSTLFNFVQFHVYESIRQVSGIKVLQTRFFEMTNFPLVANFSLDTSTQDILVSLRYEASAIDTPTAHRIANYYSNAISSVLNDPNQTHDQSLLSAAERRQLLVEWNETSKEFPTSQCVHRLFEQQAALRPHAPALDFEGHCLSYAQLNGQANQLARHLRHLGLRPEGVVGICLERSAELVVAILAVLKAGGAYLPLDPALPHARLAYMIEDAGVNLVLVNQESGRRLPQTVRHVELGSMQWQSQSQENLSVAPPLESLAYVIYTSGSTGQPKGVMSEHRGLLNRLLWMQDAFRLTPDDCVLQKTPFSFDVSVWEFLWPLMVGARLVVARPDGHKDPHYLLEVIEQQGVTTLHFVPSMLEQFVGAVPGGGCAGLRRVICSGEALSKPLQERYFEKMGGELYNLYGPTEASIDVTWWKCQREWGEEYVPIGRPISNMQVYILDGRGEPVAAGVAGELYLGGVGLARGYINNAELTAARFISNPFVEGERLYQTGDVGRYTGEGIIQYLGRTDHQVKLRGQRIELGEVEHVVGSYPGVQSVAVMLKSSAGEREYLAAYYKPEPQQGVGGKELRAFAQERLPEYMVPSIFVSVEEWPVTSNGKTDRKRLLSFDAERTDTGAAYAPPSTPTEQELVRIWQDLLPSNKIGIHDDYFELGGDSIISLQMIARARQRGLFLELKQIFQLRTIAKLAAAIKQHTSEGAEQGVILGEVPLLPIQKWFFSRDYLNKNHFNQSLLLDIEEPIIPEKLEQAVGGLLVQHDALRLRFDHKDGVWVQQYSSLSEAPPFEYQCLDGIPYGEQKSIIEKETTRLQQTLDLSAGPLMRVKLFQLEPDRRYRLFIVIHHLAVDGYSWRILLEDLYLAYKQSVAGKDIELPVKTASLKQWSNRLKVYADSEEIRAEEPYWLKMETRPHKSLPLDFDPPAGANTVQSMEAVVVKLGREKTMQLIQEVPASYSIHLNAIFMTALFLTFDEMAEGQFLLDLEWHGRDVPFDDLNISRTTGWFTSLFPFSLDVQGQTKLDDLLKTVKEQINAVPHGGIAFGLLKYVTQNTLVASAFSRLPRAEILFNYLGQMNQQGSFPGRQAPESVGPEQGLEETRHHLLEVNGILLDDELMFFWNFSGNFHRRATILDWADRFIGHLTSIIRHCLSGESTGLTPSDFPQALVDQDNLDELLRQLN